jgi:hypothetical protein
VSDDPQRAKLKKYLGKILQYTGTISFHDKSVLFTNVSHKNKVLTNHIWASCTEKMERITPGSEVTFNATAYSYIDKQNQRKYGLSKIHYIVAKDISSNDDKILKNVTHKNLRTKGNKKP